MGILVGLWKVTKISKSSDYWMCILGLHIMKMVKKGYSRFEIHINDEGEIVVKALRRKGNGGSVYQRYS
jgi:hypothetical protein